MHLTLYFIRNAHTHTHAYSYTHNHTHTHSRTHKHTQTHSHITTYRHTQLTARTQPHTHTPYVPPIVTHLLSYIQMSNGYLKSKAAEMGTCSPVPSLRVIGLIMCHSLLREVS